MRKSVARLHIVSYMSSFVWKVKGSVSETKLADNMCKKVVGWVAEPGAFLYYVCVGSLMELWLSATLQSRTFGHSKPAIVMTGSHRLVVSGNLDKGETRT